MSKPRTRARNTYQKEAQNAKALTQAMAWLKAGGIEAQPSIVNGCDLTVKDRAGKPLEVKVGISYDDPRPEAPHLFVLACELTSRHAAIQLKAFQQITAAAGFGAAKKPMDRGPEPTKKMHFDDNFELVAMRHKEFRKVPNPTTAELAQFDRIVNKAVSRFLYINAKICRRHLLQFDDLKTYAQIWTSNYLGLYKVQNPTNNDNERKLYAHLCQRFGNFVEVLLKKERNCISDPQTVSIAILGRPYEPKARNRIRVEEYEASFDDALEEDEATAVDSTDVFLEPELHVPEPTAEEEQREERLTEARRRKLAQKALKEALGSLDHDTLMTTLTDASMNSFLCFDARQEAKKQLRLHREACGSCIKVQEDVEKATVSSIKVQEELPRVGAVG